MKRKRAKKPSNELGVKNKRGKTQGAKSYAGYQLLTVQNRNKEDVGAYKRLMANARNRGLSQWGSNPGGTHVDVLAAPGKATLLDRAGIKYEVKQKDVQVIICYQT